MLTPTLLDEKMKTYTSISGGKSSAYVAANYHSDYLVFALVRIEDPNCRFPDRKVAQIVEDRIQKPFIGTAEEDTIIYTLLDLEQFIGKEIHWVSGITFEEVLRTKGGWLPNKLHRYCTTNLKIEPIFYWQQDVVGRYQITNVNIGYRLGEERRALRMMKRANKNGVLEMKASFGLHQTGMHKGKRKWEIVPYQIPHFPMINDRVNKLDVLKYWQGKPVRFADHNNCVGCFHRNVMFLKKKSLDHPNKFEWFSKMEKEKGSTWKEGISYDQISRHRLQLELSFDDFSSCDAGYCGL